MKFCLAKNLPLDLIYRFTLIILFFVFTCVDTFAFVCGIFTSTHSAGFIECFEWCARLTLQNVAGCIAAEKKIDRKNIQYKYPRVIRQRQRLNKANELAYLPIWQKMLFTPISFLHSEFASHTYFCMHFSDELATVFT